MHSSLSARYLFSTYYINKAKKAGEIAKLINEYQAALGLAADDYSNMEKYSNMMTTLFEQIPYNKFAEIGEIIDLAESLLCELNEKSWTDIADFVTKNKKIIMELLKTPKRNIMQFPIMLDIVD